MAAHGGVKKWTQPSGSDGNTGRDESRGRRRRPKRDGGGKSDGPSPGASRRGGGGGQSGNGNRDGNGSQHHQHHQEYIREPAAAITVIVNRVDLYDGPVAAKVEAAERIGREQAGDEAKGDGNLKTTVDAPPTNDGIIMPENRQQLEAQGVPIVPPHSGVLPSPQYRQQCPPDMTLNSRAVADADAEIRAAARMAMAAGLGPAMGVGSMIPPPNQPGIMMPPPAGQHMLPPFAHGGVPMSLPPQYPHQIGMHMNHQIQIQEMHQMQMQMQMQQTHVGPSGPMLGQGRGMPPQQPHITDLPPFLQHIKRVRAPPQHQPLLSPQMLQQEPLPLQARSQQNQEQSKKGAGKSAEQPHGFGAVSRSYFVGDCELVDASNGEQDEFGVSGLGTNNRHRVAVVRAPHLSHTEQSCCLKLSRVSPMHTHYCTVDPYGGLPGCQQVVDAETPNPHPTWAVHDKYWAQRRRLFSRFDMGIQLDSEGWYSVTPEIIADHVASRVVELSAALALRAGGSRLPFRNGGGGHPDAGGGDGDGANPDISGGGSGLVVLDAFAGCGGNSIAFGKLPSTFASLVVCVDIDRLKLRNAAHNAAIYGLPRDKLIFVQCNTLRVLEGCYRNGRRVDPSENGYCREPDPEAAAVERVAGFLVGGEDLLPPHIDAVFMDPPWGGVDYGALGKHGYELEKNMKIKRDTRGMEGRRKKELVKSNSVRKLSGASSCDAELLGSPPDTEAEATDRDEEDRGDSGGFDCFFDSFGSGPAPKVSKSLGIRTMEQYEQELEEGEYIDGVQLLKIAAEATRSRMVMYDLPKNTNKESLGQAALSAGYRGNIKLEEHFLNGRLKTVTAYLGTDFSGLLR